MRFRVLGHVETKKLYAERSRKPAGHLGLADARRPREEEGAHGALGIAEPRTGDADRRNDSVDRLVLTEHGASNDLVERGELTVLALGNLLGRNAGHARDELGELLHADPASLFMRAAPPSSSTRSSALSGKGLSVIQRSASATALSATSGA
jgi:hypothetical protein